MGPILRCRSPRTTEGRGELRDKPPGQRMTCRAGHPAMLRCIFTDCSNPIPIQIANIDDPP
ncbi:hypothetical protein ABH931_000874 [Streptacidiphilus sp. MAP12-33]